MITSMCQHMTSSAVGLCVFFNAYHAWFYSSSISDITSIPFTLSSLCSISTDKLSTVLCEPSLLHPVFTQFCHFPFHSSSSCCYGFCSLFSDLNDCILKQLLYYYLYTFNCPFRPVWSLFLKFILNLLTFQYVCDFLSCLSTVEPLEESFCSPCRFKPFHDVLWRDAVYVLVPSVFHWLICACVGKYYWYC